MLLTQLCPTLWDPMDCSPLGSSDSVRTLEWVAVPLSRGSSWPRDRTWVSHTAGRIFTIWTTPEAHQVYLHDDISTFKKVCILYVSSHIQWKLFGYLEHVLFESSASGIPGDQ